MTVRERTSRHLTKAHCKTLPIQNGTVAIVLKEPFTSKLDTGFHERLLTNLVESFSDTELL